MVITYRKSLYQLSSEGSIYFRSIPGYFYSYTVSILSNEIKIMYTLTTIVSISHL